MRPRILVGVAAIASVLLLGACSSPAAPDESDPASSTSTEDDGGGSSQDAPATGVDACALVPSADLAAALGVEAVDGVAADGEQGLKQCTWTYGDTHVVIAQYSADADAFFPGDMYAPSDTAAEIPGATRGFADASIGTILVVKGADGILLIDIDPGGSAADQAQWTSLGEAMLSKL